MTGELLNLILSIFSLALSLSLSPFLYLSLTLSLSLYSSCKGLASQRAIKLYPNISYYIWSEHIYVNEFC